MSHPGPASLILAIAAVIVPASAAADACALGSSGGRCFEAAMDESGLLQVQGKRRAEAVLSVDKTMDFSSYIKKFGKGHVAGTSEYELRRVIFEKNKAEVAAHNADPARTWDQALNEFSDWTHEERKQLKGYSKGARWAGLTGKHAKAPPSGESFVELPASLDWRDKGVVTATYAQGNCGGCWAFAATETVESHVAISTLGLANQSVVLGNLAPEQLVACAPNPHHCGGTGGCDGSTAQLGFDYLVDAGGQWSLWDVPYISGLNGSTPSCDEMTNVMALNSPKASIDGYVTLPSNQYEPLMQALVTKGPLAVTVAADDSWFQYSSGVADFCTNKSNIVLNHAVQLVGYGTEDGLDYWLVRNSWGATWGDEGGYIKLLRTANESENCGWDLEPADGSACADNLPEKVWVCGTCGILYDVSYPTGAKVNFGDTAMN